VTSRRLPWAAPANALSRAREGRRYVDLTESNPTRVGLRYDEAAILAALSSPALLAYDPHPLGLRAAREAVAAYYAAKGAAVDPERIVLTASTSEAYSFVFKLLCDAGDQVLVPEPSYPLFGWLTSLECVEAVPYETRFDGEWHVAGLPAAPRARAVLAVSPGNPTGAFLKRDELEAMRACGLPLIVDEVFADFPAGADVRRVETVAGREDCFALSGLSKVCGLPQVKLGWMVAPERFVPKLEMIADAYLSVSAPAQHGAAALLAARHGFQRQLAARIAANRAALVRARSASAPWDVLPSEGGWSAVLSVPRGRGEEEWALALLDAGVLVHPGYFFDFPSAGFLVVSLILPEAPFEAAASALAAVLNA